MPHTLNPLVLPEIELSDPIHDYVDKDRALDGFPEGEQNIGIYRFCCSLRANGFTYKTAEALIKTCADNCKPTSYPEEDTFEGPGWRSIIDRVWRDHPDGGEVAKKAVDNAFTYLSDDSPFPDVYELKKIPKPGPRKYLVDKLIPMNFITSLWAQGGLGKSFIALYMAMCIRLQKPVFGYATCEPCNVLYIDAELSEDVLSERAHMLVNGMEISDVPDGIHYWHLDGNILKKLDYIKSVIDYYDIGLVIIDSLTIALLGTDVMKHEAVIEAMKQLEKLGTVLVIDHTPKPPAIPNFYASQLTQYGSGFKRNLERSSLQIHKKGDHLVIRHDKTNFGKEQSDIEFQMVEGEDSIKFVMIELPEEVQKLVKALTDYGPLSASEIPQYTGLLPEEVGKFLEDSKKRGLVRPTDDGMWEAIKKKQRSALKDAIIEFTRTMNRPIKQSEFMDARPEFDKNTVYSAFWGLTNPKNPDERVLYKIGDQKNAVFWFDPELPADKETSKEMENMNLDDYRW